MACTWSVLLHCSSEFLSLGTQDMLKLHFHSLPQPLCPNTSLVLLTPNLLSLCVCVGGVSWKNEPPSVLHCYHLGGVPCSCSCSQVWWYSSVTPAPRRLRPEDYEFEASLEME